MVQGEHMSSRKGDLGYTFVLSVASGVFKFLCCGSFSYPAEVIEVHFLALLIPSTKLKSSFSLLP